MAARPHQSCKSSSCAIRSSIMPAAGPVLPFAPVGMSQSCHVRPRLRDRSSTRRTSPIFVRSSKRDTCRRRRRRQRDSAACQSALRPSRPYWRSIATEGVRLPPARGQHIRIGFQVLRLTCDRGAVTVAWSPDNSCLSCRYSLQPRVRWC